MANDINLVLESERLILRPLTLDDTELEVELGTDPEVMRYAGGTEPAQQTRQDMHKYVRRCAGGCIGVWCVADRVTGEKLGSAILLPMPIDEDDTNWDLIVGDDIPPGEIEVGYLFKRSAWGNGFATETTKRLLKFAFEETPLEEVVATIDFDNKASGRVLEKAGLTGEGVRRSYGGDSLGFRITRQQWLKARGKV
ncbi:MAG: GNAT family N-acetyltransferase [Pseudomonadota bacterium]